SSRTERGPGGRSDPPRRDDATWCAVRAAGFPVWLALVPVMGRPNVRARARGISADGTRTPTVPVPAVTAAGSEACASTTRVSGPGQKTRARTAYAGGVRSAAAAAW